MPYRNLARFSEAERAAIRASAEAVRSRMGAVVIPA